MPVIIMAMPVMVMPVLIHLPQAAFTGAERGAEIAILNIAAGCGNALAFDMVVMAFLRQADLILETKHLGAVFAHRAVHVVAAGEDFPHPVSKGGDHLIMIIEVAGLDEFNARMACRNLIGETVDTVNQDAGEEEIGEHDNPLEPQLGDVFKAGFNQREGDAGKAGFTPAETKRFDHHPRHLGHVRIGIRVG